MKEINLFAMDPRIWEKGGDSNTLTSSWDGESNESTT